MRWLGHVLRKLSEDMIKVASLRWIGEGEEKEEDIKKKHVDATEKMN